jgi:hypothetical protein
MKTSLPLHRLGQPFMVLYFLTLSGCAHYEQVQDPRHGQSVRSAISLQTVDPQALRLPSYPDGLDGERAREAFRNYLRSLHQSGAAAELPAMNRP